MMRSRRSICRSSSWMMAQSLVTRAFRWGSVCSSVTACSHRLRGRCGIFSSCLPSAMSRHVCLPSSSERCQT